MLKRFSKSVGHALTGLRYAFLHERNFRIETVCGFVVVVSLFFFDLAIWERVILICMVGWVIVMELLNTVVERMVNIVRPRSHPYPGIIKDLMASAVLVSSLVAVCVAGLIIGSHIVK